MAKIYDFLEVAGAEQVSSDPVTNLFAGRFIFNTTSNLYKYYNGSSWVAPGSSGLSLNEFEMPVGDSADTPQSLNTDLLGSYKGVVGLLTFVDGDVNTGTDEITITGHGLNRQDIIYLTNSGGALPSGLSANTPYYVIVVDANTIQLATSSSNAASGTPIDITAAAGGGTHSLHFGGIFDKQNAVKNLPDSDITLTLADGFNFTNSSLTATRAITLPTTGVKAGANFTFANTTGVPVSFKSSNGDTLDAASGHNNTNPGIAVGYVILRAVTDTPTTRNHWTIIDLYDEDNYSATTTGASTNGAAVKLRREMNLVTAVITPAADGAASGGDLTIDNSNFPARFLPQGDVLVGTSTKRNGSNRFCTVTISTTGVIVIGEADFGFTGSCFGVATHVPYSLR